METSSPAAFQRSETHGILWRPENKVHVASDDLGWSSLYASCQGEVPYEASYRGVRDHLLILHLDGPVGVSRLIGNDRASRVISPGGLFILPGGTDFGVRLEGQLESLHVYVRGDILDEVASDMFRGDPAAVELLPRLGDHDPLLERLALAVREAMQDADPTAPVYADYLARGLAARLLRAHSTFAPGRQCASPRFGLSRAQLDRALGFIAANLHKPVSLGQIAEATELSPVHFARSFKRTTGLAPHQQLMADRVERAKRLLEGSSLSLAEIAYACGFSHQQHLTKVFRARTGTTPGAFRRARVE